MALKKFSRIVENISEQKYFEISSNLTLVISAENEGEAGYLSDSILGGIKEHSDFVVNNIKEISKEEYQKQFESVYDPLDLDPFGRPYWTRGFESEEDTDEEKIIKNWDCLFGDRTPTATEKMEFYHKMRDAGIAGNIIMSTLDKKLPKSWMEKQL